ncbi:ATP-binding protein [Streptantibioticus silvisoli]|uniref:ATP-binding protein n=1 Tax=Streptantibioticus silvisoli TaxID=2705255 RepID=A0ABT6W916_9ACTN|nr:ATP-binding protein [Streptantibioticus silvisoli]MDI5966850.1 ATP-binding protein [Streptantibioticus silvisoli]
MHLLVSRLKFAATATAPRCARMFVNHTLRCWLLSDLVDDAELIVSELVTNAVKATGTLEPHPAYADLDDLAILGVQVRLMDRSLFVEVWDCDSEKAVEPPPTDNATDEGGRGLTIVDALSKRYGVARPATGGKIVWAELEAVHDAATVRRMTPASPPRGMRQVPLSPTRCARQYAQADVGLANRLGEVAV